VPALAVQVATGTLVVTVGVHTTRLKGEDVPGLATQLLYSTLAGPVLLGVHIVDTKPLPEEAATAEQLATGAFADTTTVLQEVVW
jgi:hypothetical protein